MTRRVLLAIPLAAYCRAADVAQEVVDLIADLAASLSAGNVTLFLQAFDPKMPGYAKLRENVTGLIGQGDVQSLIDPLEDEGDERRRVAQFDWTLLMHRGQEATSFARREQVLKFSVEKRGGKWRIVGLEPIEFFAP
jgi:murein L,D-transpeptidase YcbB/YkuD